MIFLPPIQQVQLLQAGATYDAKSILNPLENAQKHSVNKCAWRLIWGYGAVTLSYAPRF